jgi:hypothetical protein
MPLAAIYLVLGTRPLDICLAFPSPRSPEATAHLEFRTRTDTCAGPSTATPPAGVSARTTILQAAYLDFTSVPTPSSASSNRQGAQRGAAARLRLAARDPDESF